MKPVARGEGGIQECPLCEVRIELRPLRADEELRCRRCGETIVRRHRGDPSHHMWALSTTGLILCVLANVFPILTFDVAGNTQSNLIITGVNGLIAQGFWPVAVLVFFCSIAAPVLYFASVWYVSGSCVTGRRWPRVRLVASFGEKIAPWSLVPVFMIACFVAVVKLDMLGTVYWDSGILWIALLSICSLALGQISDPEWLERRLEELV